MSSSREVYLKCKAQGDKYEAELLKYISYKTLEKADGYMPEWDIKATDEKGGSITYEVKSDDIGGRTGNMCVEHSASGRPSGISLTTADWWANFTILNEGLSYRLHLIPTSVIKKLIEEKKYTRDIKGGEGFKSQFYLFPLKMFSEYEKEVKKKCLI